MIGGCKFPSELFKIELIEKILPSIIKFNKKVENIASKIIRNGLISQNVLNLIFFKDKKNAVIAKSILVSTKGKNNQFFDLYSSLR